MNRRHLAWAALLSGTLLLALLAQLPAHWLASRISASCSGQCRLSGVSGPWWAGNGMLLLRSPVSGNWLAGGQLSWRFRPDSANWLMVRLGAGTARLDHHGHLHIDRIVLPAEIILAQAAWKLPVAGWHGAIEITDTRLTLSKPWRGLGPGQGVVRWRQAASGLLENYPLGDLSATWQWAPSAGLSAELGGGRKGEITLAGNLDFHPDRPAQRSANLEVELAGDAAYRLDKYFRMMARPVAGKPNQYSISWPAT